MSTYLHTTFSVDAFRKEIQSIQPDSPVEDIPSAEIGEAILFKLTGCNHTDHLIGMYANLAQGSVDNETAGKLVETYFPKDRKTPTAKLGSHYLCRQRNPEKYNIPVEYRSRYTLAGGRSGNIQKSVTLDTSDSKVAGLLASFGL